ncbi:MAG: SPASM domain-containing protein, partial [Pseudomonadota bacterium]
VACVQFHGWAAKNRAGLQPTREQVAAAKAEVDEARGRLRGRLAIDFVPPDYYADYPKACMGGWGSTGLNVTPEGKVLPCHAAETIPHMTFANVRDAHLGAIWRDDPAFNAYRGTDWMPELCRSCDRRDVDFGGCRCQALAVTGDAAETDPVCIHSPFRPRIDAEIAATPDRGELAQRRFT